SVPSPERTFSCGSGDTPVSIASRAFTWIATRHDVPVRSRCTGPGRGTGSPDRSAHDAMLEIADRHRNPGGLLPDEGHDDDLRGPAPKLALVVSGQKGGQAPTVSPAPSVAVAGPDVNPFLGSRPLVAASIAVVRPTESST